MKGAKHIQHMKLQGSWWGVRARSFYISISHNSGATDQERLVNMLLRQMSVEAMLSMNIRMFQIFPFVRIVHRINQKCLWQQAAKIIPNIFMVTHQMFLIYFHKADALYIIFTAVVSCFSCKSEKRWNTYSSKNTKAERNNSKQCWTIKNIIKRLQ